MAAGISAALAKDSSNDRADRGTDNCPAGSISSDPAFLYLSAGSVWGGASPANGPVIGEASNTIEAHKLVCGRANATVPLGAFRGGKDLCAEEWAPMSEVRALREEVAELRQSNAELRGMVKELIAAAVQARH